MIDHADGSDGHSHPPGQVITRLPRRISVLGLMVAVALVGLVLGAFRIHISLGSYVAGTLAIAAVRARQQWASDPEPGAPDDDRHWLSLYVRSVGSASVFLISTILPILLLIGFAVPPWHQGLGLLMAIVAGWPLSVLMRHFWGWTT